MARARCDSRAISTASAGSVALVAIPFASVTVYEAGTTTGLGQTLYDAAIGGSALTNPFAADEAGGFEFFLDENTPVKIKVSAGGYPDQAFDYVYPISDPTNASFRNLTVTRFLTLKGNVNAAQIQAVWDAGILGVRLGEGTHAIATTLRPPRGASLLGQGPGATILEWTGASGGVMLECLLGSFLRTDITIADLTLRCHSDTATGITGINFRNTAGDIFENLAFGGILTPIRIDRGMGHTIKTIKLGPYANNPAGGIWLGSTDLSDYLYHPLVHDIQSYYSDPVADAIPDAAAVVTCSRVAAGVIANWNFFAPHKICFKVVNDTQGLSISDGVAPGMTHGVYIDADGGVSPQFTQIHNCAFDQATVAGISIVSGTNTRIADCVLTNSAQGIVVQAAPAVQRTDITDCSLLTIQNNGIVLAAGASQLSITGSRFTNMGTSSGVPIVIGNGASHDLLIAGNDFGELNSASIYDTATSGTGRSYLNNVGPAPVIATPAGTVTVHDGVTRVNGAEPPVTQRAAKTASALASTTSATFVTIPDDAAGEMSVTLTTTGGDVMAWFTGVIQNSALGGVDAVGFRLDATDTPDLVAFTATAAGAYGSHAAVFLWTGIAAGAHTVRARWRVNSGTAMAYGRTLIVMELKR